MSSIQLLVPDLPVADEILPYLREIDASRWYTNFGPLVRKLENGLVNELGEPELCAASIANCTLGLELSLYALGLAPGAKVLVPALTFAASALAVLRSGLVPVLADVDERTWLLSPEIALKALSRHNLGCVMPVAAFGCPQLAAEWDEFTRDTGIPVLIDAAGAFGNQTIGEMTTVVFSFHATKALGIGEGGLVVARDRERINRVRQLSNFGIDLSRGVSALVGTNAKMSEYHAAVGLAALARWPESKARRRKLAKEYGAVLHALCPDITLQARPLDGIYTIMQLLLPTGVDSRSVGSHLRSLGIETRCWYLPLLGMHPAFSGCVVDGELPVLRELVPRMLGIPFHLDLGREHIERICTALAGALLSAD